MLSPSINALTYCHFTILFQYFAVTGIVVLANAAKREKPLGSRRNTESGAQGQQKRTLKATKERSKDMKWGLGDSLDKISFLE